MGLGHNIYDGQRTQDIYISEDVTFDTMLLKLNTLKGLKDAGFYKPSPIQLHGIPLGKCGFDLLLEAKSGTGKTAVFTVIALEKIDLNKGLQVIVLAPTREIAMQIHDVIKEIGSRYQGLQVEVVMGGLSVQDDIEKFKKPVHIVVGSPGRLKHLVKDNFIDTSTVRMLVLDEADKLMEKTFHSDIDYINSSLPQQKQIIMSSATYPESSKTFIQSYVQNAQHICPDSNNVLLGIEQKVTVVKYNCNIVKQTQHKFIELLKILSNKQFKQGLIFCNYQARVSEIRKMLSKEKWPAEQLYGQQEQTDRLEALKTLQEYKCRLLISTDLAARGIDASNVDLVINFEPPYEWQTYLHRIGRAGRFGTYGTAITILSEGAEQNKFKTLLESINLPFDLTYFWSNDPFSLKPDENVNEQCPSTENKNPTLCQDNVHSEETVITLWSALTNDVKEEKSMENFDSLCQGFDEQDAYSEIEVFNDLLQSFQSSHNNISIESEFCRAELLELPINGSDIGSFKLCKSINNNCLKALINKEPLKKSQLGVVTIEEKKQLTETRSENSEKTFLIKEEILSESLESKPDVGKIMSHTDSIINGPCIKNNEDLADNSELLVTDCNKDVGISNFNDENAQVNKSNFSTYHENRSKTLDDLGLPTAFSSSKGSYNMPNKTSANNVLYCKNTNKEVRNKKPTKSNNKKSKGKEKCEINIASSNASFRKYKKPSVDNVEIQRNSKIQTNSTARDKPKETLNTWYLYNEQKATRQKEHNNQNYINWYNTLKLRTKQIEFFMYLNEINKVYKCKSL